jgi:peroxiredoxin
VNIRRTLLIGFSLLLLSGWAFAQPPKPIAAPPDALFKTAMLDPAGQSATLTPFRGQPVLINFWARWCGPCRVEIPELVAQHARAQKAGVNIIGIAIDDKPDAVRDFARAYDMNYPLLLLSTGDSVPLFTELGNPEVGLPYTLVIDRHGKVVKQKLGALSPAELLAAIEAASK